MYTLINFHTLYEVYYNRMYNILHIINVELPMIWAKNRHCSTYIKPLLATETYHTLKIKCKIRPSLKNYYNLIECRCKIYGNFYLVCMDQTRSKSIPNDKKTNFPSFIVH